MTKCAECIDEATHIFVGRDRSRIQLCDKHYKEWKKYEYKPPPLGTRIIDTLKVSAKWFSRVIGVLMIPVGVIIIGFVMYTLVTGATVLSSIDINFPFYSFHWHHTGAGLPAVIGVSILLVGIALTYIGWWKME